MTTSTIKKQRSNAPHSTSGDEITTSTSHPPIGSNAVIAGRDSEEDALPWRDDNYINPFTSNLVIPRAEMAKIYVLTVILFPIRVVSCVVCLVSAWMFACIGMCGITPEQINEHPLTGWRKKVQLIAAGCMRLFYAAGTFHFITFKGKKATSKEAPILVVAPHSSFADSIIVAAGGPPAIVAKSDTSEIPLLGKIITYAQPIFVQRQDPNSRQTTIREIVRRARSDEDWPHVIIFCEGTCTNRKALIKFKSGAFYPGVPVQPVILRYPNKYDTFTWTWDGPGVFRLMWMTMSTFYNNCEIEYLPVYNPTEEEKADPNLYANNVRDVMAKALEVPTSEYTFEDVGMMTHARDLKIPLSGDIVAIETALDRLNLINSTQITDLTDKFLSIPNSDKLDFITFSEILANNLKNPEVQRLFAVLDYRHVGTVSLKNMLLCAWFCKLCSVEIIEYLKAVTKLYSSDPDHIDRQQFARILKHSGKLNPKQIDALFVRIDNTCRGNISFSDFQNYTRDKSEYAFLYAKHGYIRRKLTNK